GETNVLPLVEGACAGSAGAVGAGDSALEGASASAAASAVAGSDGASSCGAGAPAPSPPMTASFVPTSTVCPSCTRISVSTPLPGAGTSVSTLSVEISSSGSSASTCSPCCLSHFVIVPSETETPICGITTSTAVSVAMPSP